jgi:UDP-glucose 4-epimerase
LIRRIVKAAEIDTVIDTRLVVDSTVTSPRLAHENNVIGTLNILAACVGPDSPVRKLVFKSSAHYYGSERDDPAFFTEDMRRAHPPATPIERGIVEAEASVSDFKEKNRDVVVTVLRFSNVLGPEIRTGHSRLFSLPVVPTILGFDPRYQFIHADDVEVIDLLGKEALPILPPVATGLAAGALRRALGVRIAPEMFKQLRYGRGLDNRKLKSTGFEFAYSTRETVLKFAEHLRLRSVLRGVREPYRYERDVEEFLRRSPSVRNRTHPEEAPRYFPPAPRGESGGDAATPATAEPA